MLKNILHIEMVFLRGEFFWTIFSWVKFLSVLPAGVGHWKWPERADMCAYLPSDIVEVIQNPSMVNGRGIYTVEEMNKYWSNFQK